MNQYDELLTMLEGAKEDVRKAFGQGNKAAGTRVRTVMQKVKVKAQAIREAVLTKQKG